MQKKITDTDLICFEEWLNNGKRNRNTINLYMSVAKRFSLDCKDYTDLEEWNNYILEHAIKKNSRYARHVLTLLLSFLDIDKNIKRFIKKNMISVGSNYSPITRRLISNDMKLLVISKLKDYKHKVMALIQNTTGVRASSILRLRRDKRCISYEEVNGKLVLRLDFISKNEKTFPMWIYDKNIANIIDDYISTSLIDNDYYFLLRNTERNKQDETLAIRSNYKRYERDLEQALIQCGLKKGDLKTHDFRRLFAKKVWDATKDLISVKESLHHARLDTTAIYLRQSGYQVKDVLELIS